MIDLVPLICERHPNVMFTIAGDGSDFESLVMMLADKQLEERVTVLGVVPNDQVQDVLQGGDLFLSVSLTESFGIAKLEAASCGLLVAATDVDGVREILPPHMIVLGEPTV